MTRDVKGFTVQVQEGSIQERQQVEQLLPIERLAKNGI
jgi:hypothetical protein